MSEFTKGPWEVDTSGYRAPGGGLCVMGGALCVAVIVGDSYKPQAENARLIAAAPDLFEALRRLESAVDQYFGPSRTGAAYPTFFDAQMSIAKAAIAKATAE